MKKVIITGADGFIGSNLSRYLDKKDIETWALVMVNSPTISSISNLKHVHIVPCNLANINEIPIPLPYDADAFYHFAWQGVAPESRASLKLQVANITMSLNALELAKNYNAKKFILPGSTSEYLYSGGLINNLSIPSPQNAYGVVKVAVKNLCTILAKEIHQPMIYSVFTGVYGANRKDNNVIYYTISKLLKGEQPQLTALEQKWDYIYIDDLIEAIYLIGTKGKTGAFYTVGHGDNCPLKEYIFKIRDIINPNLPLGIGAVPYSSDKLPSSCVDLTPLYQDTGFIPKISFNKGIRKVIDELKKEKL